VPDVELLPPYELKTMPGLRMPRADECFSREFQSVLSEDDELLLLPDILYPYGVKGDAGGGESLVLMGGRGGESDCLILGEDG
jgi:hypothetical protein